MDSRTGRGVVLATVMVLAGSVHATFAADRQSAHPESSAPPSAAALWTLLPYVLVATAVLVGARITAARRRR